MRAGEHVPPERFRDAHLAAHRTDGVVKLSQEPARVAVGGEHDLIGLELVERLNPVAFPQLRPDRGSSGGQAADPAGRLKLSYGGAPPRRAKPPFRPLAPPAISRAS
jgi:hypothetical protein